MKLEYTIATLAVATITSNAATVITSYGTVSGADDSNQAGPIYGQTITPDNGAAPAGPHGSLYLSQFEYQASGNGVSTMTTPVYLQAYDGFAVDTDGVITTLGNLIAVSNSTVNLSTISGHGNISWTFDGNTAFNSTSAYTFVMSSDVSAQTVADNADLVTGDFDLNTGNPYSGGQAHIANQFGDTTTWDMEFKATWSTTPVPEPSSTALLGLGGLALILRRRK